MQEIRFWDTASGKEVPASNGETVNPILCLRPSLRTEKRSTTSGNEVEPTGLWEVTSGKELVVGGTGTSHRSLALCTFSPTGKSAITVGYEATLRMWDATTGKPLERFRAVSKNIAVLSASGGTQFLPTAGPSACGWLREP